MASAPLQPAGEGRARQRTPIGAIEPSGGQEVPGAGQELSPADLGIVSAIPNAAIVVDRDGYVRYANRKAERLLGWPSAGLVGHLVEELVPAEYEARHVTRRRVFHRRPTSRPMGVGRELLCRRRDGSEIPVEISLGSFGEGEGMLVLATLVEISARTQLEHELTDANETLRQRADLLERRADELSLLTELGELLEACETVEEAYAAIERVASDMFATDAGALYVLAPSGTAAEAVAGWGSPRPQESVIAPADCLALRRGRTATLRDDDGGVRCLHVPEQLEVGALCVPLVAHAEAIGVLHLQVRAVPDASADELLGDRQLLLETLARHVSLAVANIRLRASLREQSSRDALTGLFNRRYLEETLDRELRRAMRERRSMGLLMADLDHFKALNDAFGHAAGDETLRRVGAYLAGAVRSEDIACRFGGEEFVIVLPGATIEDCRRRAEAIRAGVSTAAHAGSSAIYPGVTMSVGVAAYPDHGESSGELILAADTAMYRAKSLGRDRVVVAGAPRGLSPTASSG
jgi:diguanylate cyclase (GGDEF)-like protein/PAS domain S-box-containing protein